MSDKASTITGDPGDEPATLPGPAIYEEELKDYSNPPDDDPLANLPERHPEPAPDYHS